MKWFTGGSLEFSFWFWCSNQYLLSVQDSAKCCFLIWFRVHSSNLNIGIEIGLLNYVIAKNLGIAIIASWRLVLFFLDCLDVYYKCDLIFPFQILGINCIRKTKFTYFEFLNMHKVFLPNIHILGHLLRLTSSFNSTWPHQSIKVVAWYRQRAQPWIQVPDPALTSCVLLNK